MGKKSDLKNIFESYRNNVVLGEAVKPEEVDSAPRQLTPEQQAAVQNIMNTKGYNRARAEMMVLRGQDVKTAAAAAPTQPVTQPTQPVTQTAKPTVQPTQISTQPSQPTTQPAPAKAPLQPAQQNQNDDEGWTEVETTSQRMPSSTTTTTIPSSDEEYEQNDEEDDSDDEGEIESKKSVGTHPSGAVGEYKFDGTTIKTTPVVEKINISKFLKHLSEKNYSSAHKYLKAILNSKINNIVSERIDKNFK